MARKVGPGPLDAIWTGTGQHEGLWRSEVGGEALQGDRGVLTLTLDGDNAEIRLEARA